jgi:hypothetical protein
VLAMDDWEAPEWWPECKLPTIESIQHALAGCVYFAVLDLRSWFYQIAVSHGPTIRIGSKFFKFLRLPQGWTGAPALAQLILLILLATLRSYPVIVKGFLDNVVIGGGGASIVLDALAEFRVTCRRLGIQVKESSVAHGRQVDYVGMRVAHTFQGGTQVTLLPEFLSLLQERVPPACLAPTVSLRGYFGIMGSLIHAARVLHFPLGAHLYQGLAFMSQITKGAPLSKRSCWDSPVSVPANVHKEWGALLELILHQGVYYLVPRAPLGFHQLEMIVDAGPVQWGMVFGNHRISFWVYWAAIPDNIAALGQIHREVYGLHTGLKALKEFMAIRYPKNKGFCLELWSDCYPLLLALQRQYSPSFALNATVQAILSTVGTWVIQWRWVEGSKNLADGPSRCGLPTPEWPLALPYLVDYAKRRKLKATAQRNRAE